MTEVNPNGHRAGHTLATTGEPLNGVQKPTQSELLIGYIEDAELFHDAGGDGYATIRVKDHLESWPLKSQRFSQWLLRCFYLETGKAPGSQALTDARATITAKAIFEGQIRAVCRRIARHHDAIYLDLCNEQWEAVKITAVGWETLSSEVVPIKFTRKDNSASLPHPESGGTVESLRPLLNVKSQEDFRLLVGWLVGALNPEGPFPVLVLQGEQGSAKSTTVRVLRSMVDPAVEPLRAPPRDERDLAIAASGNWTPALDNLSGVRPWLSDALCRLATGGGFATRELYSDDREVLFSQKRPVILNGIDSLAVAGDLRDRSLVVELPPIPPSKKRTEREFYKKLAEIRPKVLGALLDAVSAALRNLDQVELQELPRMADFAVWVTAAEEALPWPSGAFVETYAGNRVEADEIALDTDPVAVAVRDFMMSREEWSGTATDLYASLADLVDEDVRRSRAWPSAPNALSNRMKRIAPSLREVGIEYGDERAPGGSRTRRKHLKKTTQKDRPECPDRPNHEHESSDHLKPGEAPQRDTGDGRDGGLQDPSERERFVL